MKSSDAVGFSAGYSAAKILALLGAGLMADAVLASTWQSAGVLSSSNVTGLVALADGRALVVHGTTSEIYNPTTNTWGSSATLKGDHGNGGGKGNLGDGLTLTLLPSGKVLLVGTTSCSTATAAITSIRIPTSFRP